MTTLKMFNSPAWITDKIWHNNWLVDWLIDFKPQPKQTMEISKLKTCKCVVILFGEVIYR